MPEHEKKIIAQVVTETKQTKTRPEEEEEQSTGSDLTNLSVTQVGTTINLPSIANSRLDTKLKHLLTTYFLAINNKHEVRKIFSENDFYQFEEFISWDKQALIEMRRKKNNTMVGFNNQKITLIHDVIFYYNFLQSETRTKALAEEPTQWVREDFKTWRDQGCHPNIASVNESLSGTTANATAPPATTVTPEIKKAENAWMS